MMSPPRLGRDNLSGKRTYTECSSRSGSGGPLRRGRVAAQCRLSAPNAEGKQKRHCAIKLNANGRLDNLLSAIRRSSPHEAGGGTKTGVITTMGDPFELLRHAQTAYNNDLRPWEQSKEYWDRLKKFCDYSERWRKEQEKDIVWPKPKDVGVVRKGTTEWDVFHELSMKRLKRNGIHL
jgi:hypothetical protein